MSKDSLNLASVYQVANLFMKGHTQTSSKMIKNILNKISAPALARRTIAVAMQQQQQFDGIDDQKELPIQHSHKANILMRSLFYVKRSKIANSQQWYNVVPADGFVLDMEDATPYDKKTETRAQMAKVIRELPQNPLPHILVRMNSLKDDHPDAYWKDDVRNTAHPRLLAYIVPKIRHPEEIHEVSAYLEKCEREMELPIGHHKLVALIETADGIQKSYDIAKSDDRLIAMTVGRFDLINSLKCSFDSAMMRHACNNVAIAARAANVIPLLSVNCDLDNHAGFERECLEARNFGYGGRSTVTIKQVQTANTTFMVGRKQADEAGKILESGKNGLAKTSDGQMIGPPHKKEAASVLRRFTLQNMYEKEKQSRISHTATSNKHWSAKRFPGFAGDSSKDSSTSPKKQKLISPFEITINEGVRTFWEQHFFPVSKLNTSANFAKSLGFRDTLVPFSLLANWAMSLSVMSFSMKAIVHVELVEAVQYLPVYYGDTIINEVTITDVEQKKQGYDIVSSRHDLVRLQDGKTVFSALKMTMLPRGIFPKQEINDGTDNISDTRSLLCHMSISSIERALTGHPVSKGQLYVHDLVKSFGPSDAITLSYYLKGVNPLHINNQLKHDQLLVSGPCVVAAAVANHGFDFGDILDEKWSNFRSINKTLNNDLISSISYVQDVRPLTMDNVPLEEITLTVAGIKNVNPEVLAKLDFPPEIFLQKMRPRDFEKVCLEKVPELSHKVVCLGRRTIVRYQPAQ